MKLQDQVCTEDQAKRLHELGVAQSGYYSYAHRVVNSKPCFNGEMTEWEAEYSETMELVETGLAQFDGLPHVSVFTVAELMAMLPPSISFVKKSAILRVVKLDASEYYGDPESYIAGYYLSDKEPVKDWVMGHGRQFAAVALADLLIMVMEQGKTTVTEINQRLTS
jgi:hypothetical protein